MLLQGLLKTWLQLWLFKVVMLLCNVDVLAEVVETLIQELEINFQPMVSWMLLGLCIPTIGYR
jgi:hypothetical protein